ncbi:MAG TPA: polyketide synthase dehydratase domain-containing protein, partial [Bacillota bacterium]|nr:polyketide synthase dehydratase domain-containing protein [Bacillota bacterium]
NIIFRASQNGQVLIQLKLPDEFKEDLQDYGIHPALMDQATAAFSQSTEETHLPLMFKRMAIYGRMPSGFYCHIRRKDRQAENMETILLDATLIDESGQVFIDIEDYSLKRVKDKKV